jgi:VIT1/CCC1 family predicted Fe2+/Mn2+ transporter
MEREVHEILGPYGLDQSVSRRIAGCLLKSEADFVKNPPSARSPSWFKQTLRKIARTPSALKDYESLPDHGGNLMVGCEDVGMTAFLLKFGEGMEDVPTSRLWISAVTIGGGYLTGGIIPLVWFLRLSNSLR